MHSSTRSELSNSKQTSAGGGAQVQTGTVSSSILPSRSLCSSDENASGPRPAAVDKPPDHRLLQGLLGEAERWTLFSLFLLRRHRGRPQLRASAGHSTHCAAHLARPCALAGGNNSKAFLNWAGLCGVAGMCGLATSINSLVI